MPNEVLVKAGTQIRFSNSGEFSPAAKTNLTVGTPTDVDFDLAGGGGIADGAGQESAKVDLGATRARSYSVMAAIESGGTAPTAGQGVDLYWAPSPISTAANGNPGQIDGVDGVAPSGYGTLAELLPTLIHIGACIFDNTINNVMVSFVGVFSPPERYGILIAFNNTDQTLQADAVESHVVFTPITDEVK